MKFKIRVPFAITLSAALAVSLPLTLTGCRFGNHVEKQAQEATISGLYNTTPRRLSYCVETDHETCAAADSVVPIQPWAGIMSDPVYLGVYSANSHKGAIINVNDIDLSKDQRGFNIDIGDQGAVSFTQVFKPTDLDTDAGCTSQVVRRGQGSAIPGPAPSYDGLAVSGSIQMTLSEDQSFNGDCKDFLTVVEACYLDKDQCGEKSDQANSEVQDYFREFFNDYVARGILAPDEISDLKRMGYRLGYE